VSIFFLKKKKKKKKKRHLWYFSQKGGFRGFLTPKLFDTELILNNQVKYLGVILDSKLNWKYYIDNRIRKASIAMP
jgi:hypothetical protein